MAALVVPSFVMRDRFDEFRYPWDCVFCACAAVPCERRVRLFTRELCVECGWVHFALPIFSPHFVFASLPSRLHSAMRRHLRRPRVCLLLLGYSGDWAAPGEIDSSPANCRTSSHVLYPPYLLAHPAQHMR